MKNTEIYTDTPDMRFEYEIKREEKFPIPLFSSPNSPPNSTMQNEDSPSHQNVGKCMEY
jgi:hypothetical protein